MTQLMDTEELSRSCARCGHMHGVHGSIFDGGSGECYEPDEDCDCLAFSTGQLLDCDRCGQHVEAYEDAVRLDAIAGRMDAVGLAVVTARHLFPTGICPGSPSRAQYLEGQPRDTRGYPYEPSLEPLYRDAYAQLLKEHPKP